ncbi:hypothetical protein [Natronosalvus caseinilyticus]|uniref:hypothetical protein n=1 Tax=Natronosalvus caseinilyticus TaxID=2953747 RepID=UPI0028AD48E8|nr:hypothetical protein [Natronosalvus caseinilyticus]
MLVSSSTLGGCLEEDSHEVGLGKINVTNYSENRISTVVTVEKEGRTVYTEEHALEGTANGSLGRIAIVEEWMDEKTPYNVEITVDGDHQNSFSTRDANEFFSDWGANECYFLDAVFEAKSINFAVGGLESCP